MTVGGETMLDLADVTGIFLKSSDSISTLWSFYAAASFAAAGFAASAKSLSGRTALLMIGGYIVFIAGHLSLLDHAIRIERAAGSDLTRWLIAHPTSAYAHSVSALTKAQSSWVASCIIHACIDFCIITTIWVTAHSAKREHSA